jgi:TfoX/Sxy family transcriptional regulator of competence genes
MPSPKKPIPRRPMPIWTRPPAALVAQFARMVAPLPDVETRKMFGYPAAFINGQMFSSLFQSSMILRLDESGRAQLAREHEARAFEPMPGRPMREYMGVPAKLLRAEPELARWLRRARDYAASLPPKEKGKLKPAKR